MIIIDENKKLQMDKDKRIAKIKYDLTMIDSKSLRPLRAVSSGTASDDDIAYLASLEAEANNLRNELKELLNG